MEGALMKGGIGPEDAELGVDVPDEAGVDTGVFLRADFFAMVYIWYFRGSQELFSDVVGCFEAGDISFGASLVRSWLSFYRKRVQMIKASGRVRCQDEVTNVVRVISTAQENFVEFVDVESRGKRDSVYKWIIDGNC